MESLISIPLINLQTLVLANEYFPFFPLQIHLSHEAVYHAPVVENLRTKETCQAIALFKLTLFQT